MATAEMTGREIAIRSTQEIQLMADEVAKSGMFGMNKSQAFVLMLICQSKQLDPIEAVLRYDVIQNRPAMKAAAILAEFQSRGGRCKWLKTEKTVAQAEFSHPTLYPEPLVVTFTMEDAREAGLANKDNWRKNPADMLVARVISRGVRRVMPGVVTGIYTPEEIDAIDVNAQVVDISPQPVTTGPAPGLSSRAGINATFAPSRANGHHETTAQAADVDPSEADELDEARARTWQAFATARAARFNTGWNSLAAEHGYELTSEALRAPVNHYRLTQAVASLAVDDGLVEPPAKRDNAWAAGVCKELFRDNPQWAADTANRYLRTKLAECKRAVAKTAPAELPDDDPEPHDEAAEILRTEGGHDDE